MKSFNQFVNEANHIATFDGEAFRPQTPLELSRQIGLLMQAARLMQYGLPPEQRKAVAEMERHLQRAYGVPLPEELYQQDLGRKLEQP